METIASSTAETLGSIAKVGRCLSLMTATGYTAYSDEVAHCNTSQPLW
jgi:hypothetical protein